MTLLSLSRPTASYHDVTVTGTIGGHPTRGRSDMKNLNGKVAVITGGASGIGLGMARAFAGAGMHLVIADLDDAARTAALAEFHAAGIKAIGQRCDVSSQEQVQALARMTMDNFGGVHVLCNNAGVGIPTATHPMKLADWRWIIDVDLYGPIYGIDAFLPIMEAQGEGHINATSSMAGLFASGFMGAYNVAKHGVVALMATLARDLAGRKSAVTASVLCPGPINTNISRHSVAYRPGHAKPAADGVSVGQAAKGIQKLLEEQGMDPDEVGRIVLDAIHTGRFWILTHPDMAKIAVKQTAAMAADGSLTGVRRG
ncbi:MAG: SDR family NAD(P)-dependent oxidoreductase [Gammaproteobacteria bacterium]|nr:SDR family NAD(P)-dependent oxidoreductase [Gammaproteobacteria bacterium]